MMQVPEDYRAEFSKPYAIKDYRFAIEVQYRGIFLEEDIQATCNVWWFKLIDVDGTLLLTGPVRERTEGEELTKEMVADRLARFYGNNSIDQLRKKAGVKKASEEALQPSLEELVELCRSYMFAEFYSGWATFAGGSDYDIIQSITREGGWTILLSPAIEPMKIYMFNKNSPDAETEISVYIRAHHHVIPKF